MKSLFSSNARNALFLLAFGTIIIVIVAAIQNILLTNISTTDSLLINKKNIEEELETDLVAELDLGTREPGTTEEIEIRSTLLEPKITIALIRIYVNGGIIKDFNSDLFALPVCDNLNYFDNNRVCADITKMDPIDPGEVLATVTIEWDEDIEGSIWQEREGGYYTDERADVVLDISDLPLTGDDKGYGESTPDGSFIITDELRMFISAGSLLIMIGITYISEKFVKAKNATKIFKAVVILNFLFIIFATSIYISNHYFAPSDTLAYDSVDRDELVTPLKSAFTVTNPYGFACIACSGPGDNFHSGIDLGPQQVIYAAGPGRVIHAGVVTGWTPLGNMVTIEHTSSNGSKYYTRYAHFQEVYVDVGDIVDDDTRLGMMGATGNARGIHLHFEVRKATNTWLQSDFYDPTQVIYRLRDGNDDQDDQEDQEEQEGPSEPLQCGDMGCTKDDDCLTGVPDYECDESSTDWPNNNQCVRICPSGYTRSGMCDCVGSLTPTPVIVESPIPTPQQAGTVCGPIDSNGDHKLDYVDFANIRRKYNQYCLDYYDDEECGGLDSNHDNFIDYKDFYSFTSRYYPRAMNCNKRDLQ